MIQATVSPVVLVILDGWGYRREIDGNAIANAKIPVMNSLWETYPKTLIKTSGKAVGLPDGQMGNSEVGHLNIGAGRVVPQELVRITDAVENRSILLNSALLQICNKVKSSNGKLHLMGLCSEGGVHSHLQHLNGLLDLAKSQGIIDVCVHAFTDGRDTRPTAGVTALKKIEEAFQNYGIGRISTISGRYYAMDRDRRWERVKQAYDVMVKDGAGDGRSAVDILKSFYQEEITDEFIPPTRVTSGTIEPGDGVIFFNFRPDRARQLTSAFVSSEFDGFERKLMDPLPFLTFTQYDPSLPVTVAFEPQNLSNILGEVIANHNLKQFRTAETEKYPHVTYFFNGGLEEPLPGEERKLISSPMVATYDRAPAMSAVEVTDVACKAIEEGIYSLVVINYANPDMVGHTGKMDATVDAIEAVDQCLGKLLASVNKVSGTTLITADHGNSEYMWDEQGNPWTAHTTNPVPFIMVEGEARKIPGHGTEVEMRKDGCLADIAPTILEILKLPQPKEMTGQSLIKPLEVEFKQNRTPIKVSL